MSTCKVIDHLLQKKAKFNVIHNDDFMDYINISIDSDDVNIFFDTPKGRIALKDITAVWYRRGCLNRKFFYLDEGFYQKIMEAHLQKEWKYVQEFLHALLEKLPSIGSYEKATHTKKLWNLYLAQKNGLEVPKTLVSNDQNRLRAFFDDYQPVITKSIERDLTYSDSKHRFGAFGTRLIHKEQLSKINNKGFAYHSLIQNCLDKLYELRVFYLKENMWTMAIFSQSNPQTSIDYRTYDEHKPNRMIPYKLNPGIEEKIITFMQEAGLNTGSLDFVVTKEGKLIFLEVNPVGQYDFVSQYCNYHLDDEIAKTLF